MPDAPAKTTLLSLYRSQSNYHYVLIMLTQGDNSDVFKFRTLSSLHIKVLVPDLCLNYVQRYVYLSGLLIIFQFCNFPIILILFPLSHLCFLFARNTIKYLLHAPPPIAINNKKAALDKPPFLYYILPVQGLRCIHTGLHQAEKHQVATYILCEASYETGLHQAEKHQSTP